MTSRSEYDFRLQAFHLLRGTFPDPSSSRLVGNSCQELQALDDASHYPVNATVAALHINGLGWFPFARRYSGSRGFFLFLGLLRCFSSPRSPSHPIYSGTSPRSPTVGVSPFRYPRIKACLSAPRGLSQTSHVFRRFLAPEHPPCTLSTP